MGRFWKALSWNYDRKGLKYVSSIEAWKYPFIGVQFHPEKNVYEWSYREPRIPHSKYDWNAVTRRGHTEMNKHKSGSHLPGLISLVTADDFKGGIPPPFPPPSPPSMLKWWFKLSRHAVHVSLYFATHFVNLARLSRHAFHDRFLPSIIYRLHRFSQCGILDWRRKSSWSTIINKISSAEMTLTGSLKRPIFLNNFIYSWLDKGLI